MSCRPAAPAGRCFIDIQNRHQVVILKDEANLSAAEDGQFLILEGEDFLAVHLDAAAGRAVQSAEHMQQGGFAGAGGANDGNKLPFLHREVDAVQRVNFIFAGAVNFCQVACL